MSETRNDVNIYLDQGLCIAPVLRLSGQVPQGRRVVWEHQLVSNVVTLSGTNVPNQVRVDILRQCFPIRPSRSIDQSGLEGGRSDRHDPQVF